jgi:peptide/nickel transport system substrate-binding protein
LEEWPKIHQVLNLKEKLTLYSLILILFVSLIVWGVVFYHSKTNVVPAFGGEYIEGIVGQPQHINPVLALSNNTDDDLTQLIFSSLLKYDAQGNLVNDLTDNWEISEDKTTYTFFLKQNALWHDGQKLTAKDIFFTINLITDPSYKSPLRYSWQSIETNVVDDYTLTFKIKNPHAGFLHNLTFGILPKHIWENIESDNFPLTDLNLEPIGSGPFKYASLQKDSTGNIIAYKLVANPNYYFGKPYLSKMTFNFYADDSSILTAYNQKEIMGISSLSAQKISGIKNIRSTFVHKFNLPRYFAVFFNQNKSLVLTNPEVREALNLATNRQEIIDKVLLGSGYPVFSPITKNMLGYSEEIGETNFGLDEANQLLEEKGWLRNEEGFRVKNNVPLEINLVTADWLELAQTGELLKAQWEKIGAKINLSILSISDIQQNYIRPREYDALLFGQVLGGDSDLYSFWHSSQKKDPGLNLSVFGDDATDSLIEKGRAEFDNEKRAEIYRDFQKQLVKQNMTVFLYSPSYVYPVRNSVQGIDFQNLVYPSKRFSTANTWFIKTQRIWK